jgi:nucleotide-binding universal stress UspA family protein
LRLLLAIEPTDTSGVVARQVAARPWPDGTVARVLTVIEYAAVPSEVWKEADGDMEFVRRAMQSKAEGVVARAANELTAAGLLAECFILEGDPRMDIVDEAKEGLADFIFIRSHVFHSITRWLMGSVAKTVLRDAPCSVEVVRPASDEAELRGRRGMKILLATDGSECSKAAASSVAARPWPENSEVKVISATDPFGFSVEDEHVPVEKPIGESDPRGEVYLTREERAVREAKAILADAGLKLTGAVVSGYPKAAIVDEAKVWGADLIVVGAHGRRGLERLLTGSVSEAVAMHAHCSVEVIRSPVLWEED